MQSTSKLVVSEVHCSLPIETRTDHAPVVGTVAEPAHSPIRGCVTGIVTVLRSGTAVMVAMLPVGRVKLAVTMDRAPANVFSTAAKLADACSHRPRTMGRHSLSISCSSAAHRTCSKGMTMHCFGEPDVDGYTSCTEKLPVLLSWSRCENGCRCVPSDGTSRSYMREALLANREPVPKDAISCVPV